MYLIKKEFVSLLELTDKTARNEQTQTRRQRNACSMERRRINNNGNNYFNLFNMQQLNQDQKDLIGGVILFIAGAIFLCYLVVNNTRPVIDANSIDYQTYQHVKHELPKSYTKYCEHVYNDKFGK